MARTPLIRSLLAAGLLLACSASAQTYSRTEAISYSDNLSKWVLGQTASMACVAAVPASASCDGDVFSQTTFNATTALPMATYAFGKLQQTLAYNADGTLKAVSDGNGHTTTFFNWYRGIPRLVTYADASTQSAVVNAQGWINSITDEAGATTAYGYDAMGRINRITHPTGDSTVWNDTLISFVPIDTSEYGIGANHWRQTVRTGNGYKVSYFDALWRPLLVREYDSADVTSTQRFSRKAYDADGRVTFASYPSGSSNPTTGVWTEYDALGRTSSVTQDSELGLLTATTAYPTGFQTRVTDPRGNSTTTQFMAYDQPGYDQPVLIDAPEATRTTILHDPYGKPLSITRGATP